jgi:hypothetical protein
MHARTDLNKLAPEALQQFEQARQTAFDTLDTGVIGDDTTDVVVTISGHANPNHRRRTVSRTTISRCRFSRRDHDR